MIKYLHIPVENGYPIQIPVDGGIFVVRDSAIKTSIYLASSLSHHIHLVTANATDELKKAIEDALVNASVRNWMDAISVVKIPEGQSVISASVTPGN